MKNVVASNIAKLCLDGIVVDDSGEVSDGHKVSCKLIATLLDALLAVGAKDVVESFKSILGEDYETTNMTTWSELEEVKSVHVANINTWKVAGASLDLIVVVTVDDKRTLAENETGVSHLGLTRASALLVTSTVEICAGTGSLKGAQETLGVINMQVVNNQRKFGNVIDLVTASLDKWCAGRSSKSGRDGVSVLVGVGLSVPSSPDLERGEHTALAAHVTEGTLA